MGVICVSCNGSGTIDFLALCKKKALPANGKPYQGRNRAKNHRKVLKAVNGIFH
jgi:hypothetical protein